MLALLTDEQVMLQDMARDLGRKLGLRGVEARDIPPLTGTEAEVIREVVRNPRTTPTRVAEVTGIRRSNVSTAIRVLESRGFLLREHPEGDARAIELVPTDFAEENLGKIREYWATRLKTAPAEVLEDCVKALDALQRLDEHLGR